MEMIIQKPFDAHLHLRQGDPLSGFAQRAAAFFESALVMPNTKPPILTAADLIRYRNQIRTAAPALNPLMTFQLHTGADIPSLKQAGAVAAKYFPVGLTNSTGTDASSLAAYDSVLKQMEEAGIVLSIHCEAPLYSGTGAKHRVLDEALEASVRFPELKIVLEHVSLEREVEAVKNAGKNVAATVTAHHLLFSAVDFIGSRLNPHLFCKPILQSEENREAVRRAVLSGNPRFFFGSDSAPHPPESKTGSAVSPGIYSMPVTIPLLACFFEEYAQTNCLENFVSVFGRRFYGLAETDETLVLEKRSWKVPEIVDGVVPLGAGTVISWSVRSSGVC
ncbi:MAG: dihydroorotase [Spirochaetia bacterium]|nr:dihydroorotase [Spirochaetia bacterium]